MENHKRRSIWFNFSSPAIIASIYLSLQFLIEFPVAFLLFIIQLSNDIVISKLIVLVISQIALTAIFLFIVIPLLKVKDVEFKSISYTSLSTFALVFCIFWAIMIPITLGLSVISNNSGVEVDIFNNTLKLSEDQSGNLITIFIWLIAGTLGVAISLEYLYRRTLIPLLEKRGMSPFFAVLTSSLAFALINIPFNLGFQFSILRESNLLIIYLSRYNLLNSLLYSFNLFFTTFLIGIACGIVYILTRNILFSIMVHCFVLLPYYLMQLFDKNVILSSILGLLIIVLNISGLFIAFYTLYHSSKSSFYAEWITILKKKSLVDINRGLIGFFIIFFGIIINIVVFLGLLAEHAPVIVPFLFHIVLIGFSFKNLREDSMTLQPDADHHELKESADVS
jgi:membrane protease YdiL (CAAX protease family)